TDVDLIQSNKHNILKDERLLKEILPNFKDMPTKNLIKMVHIESFKIDVLSLIKKDYNLSRSIFNRRWILFKYNKRTFNKCDAVDITEYVKGSGFFENN
ncbi:MAG: DUF4080 domain-containing protein, partial [Tissierellales bacterium]